MYATIIFSEIVSFKDRLFLRSIGQTYGRNFSPFYRTSSPVGAAALLRFAISPNQRGRARVPLTSSCLLAFYLSYLALPIIRTPFPFCLSFSYILSSSTNPPFSVLDYCMDVREVIFRMTFIDVLLD